MVNNYKLGECGERPWGYWKVDEISDGTVKKTIVVYPLGCLSLQSHEYRSEKWEIVEGIAEVTVNQIVKILRAGETAEIPLNAVHRLKNAGAGNLVVREIQYGDVLDESDITRYEDIYGRDFKTAQNKILDNIFVADMDGTLTPARLPMTEKFVEVFEKFLENHTFFIVSGSDFKKIEEQVPKGILNKVAGIYSSMGNELYVKENVIYRNDFTPEESLIEKLEEYRKNTAYPHELFSNYIEKRRGMVNFSVLGRDCPQQARDAYKLWDNVYKEREKIARELTQLYPLYDISIGGNISIDIVPQGFGKDQIADRLRDTYKREKIIFIGDRVEHGGNDYPLAKRLLELGNTEIVSVRGPEDTFAFLKDKI